MTDCRQYNQIRRYHKAVKVCCNILQQCCTSAVRVMIRWYKDSFHQTCLTGLIYALSMCRSLSHQQHTFDSVCCSKLAIEVGCFIRDGLLGSKLSDFFLPKFEKMFPSSRIIVWYVVDIFFIHRNVSHILWKAGPWQNKLELQQQKWHSLEEQQEINNRRRNK